MADIRIRSLDADGAQGQREALIDLPLDAIASGASAGFVRLALARARRRGIARALGCTGVGGPPEYAGSPHGKRRASAICFKTLFLRNPR